MLEYKVQGWGGKENIWYSDSRLSNPRKNMLCLSLSKPRQLFSIHPARQYLPFPRNWVLFFFFFQLYVSHVLRWLPMVSSLYFKLLWARMSLNIFLHDTWHAPCIKMVMMKTLQIMSPKVMSGQVTGELSQDLGYSLLLNQLRQSHPLFPF